MEPKVMRHLFNPRSVAVVGATDSPDRVGYNLLESILYGGYAGKVYPVHPRLGTLQGLTVYPSLEDIPGPVDVAVVAVNQHATVETIARCGRLGIKAAICVAGGYRETGDDGLHLEERLVSLAREHGMALVGPNTLGLINTGADFYSTFYPLRLPKGNVSLVSQSGGMGLTMMHKAADEGLGVNKWVGGGNRSTLEISHYLEYLARDEETGVIGIFLEGTEEARELVRAASRIAKTKPVVVYKAGRFKTADFAALTHTGTAAGSYRMYRDIFMDQFGVLMVDSVAELVAACKALSLSKLPAGEGLGIVTHTAGPSIALLDLAARRGIPVPTLQEETIGKIKGVLGLNPPVVLKNPLDTVGVGFEAGIYGRVVNAVLEDPAIDLMVAIYCWHKNWRFPSPELLAAQRRSGKPVLAYYVTTWEDCREERRILQEAGVPLYISPEEAAGAVSALVHYSNASGREKDAG
ncbi:MAG: CoA-binding protein [Firmicutes bacterium]|nr:CoA-binding protein [Bacillota bacterium]